jgi:predicted nucleotidyltransferase
MHPMPAPPPKASLFRLDPEAHSALLHLGKLLGRPMNKLINEAVRDYLLKTSEAESEVEQTLANLRAYRSRNLQVAEPVAAYERTRAAEPNAAAVSAAREFIRRVSARHPVKAALLFGSRARGTHRPESDVDVAVLLRGRRGKLMDTSLELADIAFEMLLETNIYIQPVPIWEDEWEHPETHSNPRLLENIRREGLPL